jgi:hypothetical protein
MRRSERALARWASWSIGTGLVVAAWFVALVTPGDDRVQDAFRVETAVGSAVTGRNIAVAVDDIRRSGRVATADGWSAEGNWVVVDLEAAAVVSESPAKLGHVELVIGDTRFRASERPESLFSASLAVGVPQTGSLAFELPEGLDAGAAVLELALDDLDTRLDSMVVVPFELDSTPHVAEIELRETDWSAR